MMYAAIEQIFHDLLNSREMYLCPGL